MEKELRHYLATALWSSTGDDGEPLDGKYSPDDFAMASLLEAAADLKRFSQRAGELLSGLSLPTVAHDFWLTRNHHGAGFWDGDYPKVTGELLTKLAHEFGEKNVVEVNGTLFFE